MKLLLDENLSRRLVPALQSEFARDNGFVLVSKDEDFQDLQTLRGYPPKLVVLRLGNASNQLVLDTLLDAAKRVIAVLQQDGIGVVEIA